MHVPRSETIDERREIWLRKFNVSIHQFNFNIQRELYQFKVSIHLFNVNCYQFNVNFYQFYQNCHQFLTRASLADNSAAGGSRVTMSAGNSYRYRQTALDEGSFCQLSRLFTSSTSTRLHLAM